MYLFVIAKDVSLRIPKYLTEEEKIIGHEIGKDGRNKGQPSFVLCLVDFGGEEFGFQIQ